MTLEELVQKVGDLERAIQSLRRQKRVSVRRAARDWREKAERRRKAIKRAAEKAAEVRWDSRKQS